MSNRDVYFISLSKSIEIIKSFKNKKIAVVGDSMLDSWIWGKVSRISPEAPVPVVDVDHLSYTPGGAANVVNNITGLGAKVAVFTITGDDENGVKLSSELSNRGVDISGIIKDKNRPTTTKTRIMAGSQQLCRIDTENKKPVSDEISEVLLKTILDSVKNFDILVLSDYNKGLFKKEFVDSLISNASLAGVNTIVGPKPANMHIFKGAKLMALNEKEAREASKNFDSSVPIEEVGQKLKNELSLDSLLVTRGDKGMVLFEKDEEPFSIPALASEVYDVSGAGDTVLSVASLAIASGASLKDSIVLANFAAAVVVKKVGTATLTPSELIDVIEYRKENFSYRENL